jgi:hypothetical protein
MNYGNRLNAQIDVRRFVLNRSMEGRAAWRSKPDSVCVGQQAEALLQRFTDSDSSPIRSNDAKATLSPALCIMSP